MKQFLFIKTATDVVALPASALLRTEYTSDTSVSLFFETTKSGKNATTVVVLSVTSGKASEVINRIVGTTASTSRSVLIYDDVKDEFSVAGVTGILSITTTEGPAETILSGGEEGEVLTKNTSTDYDVSWQDVHTLYVEVRNQSGGTLAKGTPVHATGATGDVADVIAARADTASAMPATYVLNEEIADGANGQAIISGTITGVDTSSFSPGDVIHVGPTGGFTNVKPTGTNLIQNLGVVTKSNASTGSGVVLGSGRANDVPNIPNGQAWIGNASGVATPTTLATVATSGAYSDLSGTPTIPSGTVDTSGTPADNQIAVFTDADTIEGDSNLVWNGSSLQVTGTRIIPATTAGNQYYGDIVTFGSGPGGVDGSIVQGSIYYLDSTQQWELADASAVSTANGMIGIAIATGEVKFLIRGIARHSDWSGLGTGSPLYISNSSGELTTTAPSTTGDAVRVIGHCTNTSTREIYFNPSPDWIEVA